MEFSEPFQYVKLHRLQINVSFSGNLYFFISQLVLNKQNFPHYIKQLHNKLSLVISGKWMVTIIFYTLRPS